MSFKDILFILKSKEKDNLKFSRTFVLAHYGSFSKAKLMNLMNKNLNEYNERVKQ